MTCSFHCGLGGCQLLGLTFLFLSFFALHHHQFRYPSFGALVSIVLLPLPAFLTLGVVAAFRPINHNHTNTLIIPPDGVAETVNSPPRSMTNLSIILSALSAIDVNSTISMLMLSNFRSIQTKMSYLAVLSGAGSQKSAIQRSGVQSLVSNRSLGP